MQKFTPPLKTHFSINNQQSEALWSLWSCALWPRALTPDHPALRGEPVGSLKGGEVPMRMKTGERQRSKTWMMLVIKRFDRLAIFWPACCGDVQDVKTRFEEAVPQFSTLNQICRQIKHCVVQAPECNQGAAYQTWLLLQCCVDSLTHNSCLHQHQNISPEHCPSCNTSCWASRSAPPDPPQRPRD